MRTSSLIWLAAALAVLGSGMTLTSRLALAGVSTQPMEAAALQCIVKLTSFALISRSYDPGLLSTGRTGLSDLDDRLESLATVRLEPIFDLSKNAAKKRALGMDRFFFVRYASDVAPADAVENLGASSAVEHAEANGRVHLHGTPNDYSYKWQWAHDNRGQASSWNGGGPVGTIDCDIDTDLAWDHETGSEDVTIAILDTGVDLEHEEFVGRIVPGHDPFNGDSDPSDEHGHGTSCAGIAAAAGNNERGIAGVAWGVRIMPIKVLNVPGDYSLAAVASGVEWATDHGADILSMSFAHEESESVKAALDYAYGEGLTLFAGTGNDDLSTISYPARHAHTIAVGALTPCEERKSPSSCDGEVNWGSNYGAELDFLAPGTRIYATDLDNGYRNDFGGTSSATPHAAGIAALLLSANPDLTNDEIRAIMRRTCVDLYAAGWDEESGFGRVNAYGAVLHALPNAVWVDFAFTGSENGTFMEPYNTLAEGLGAVPPDGVLVLKGNSSMEAPTIDSTVTLLSYEANTTVGQ